MGVRVGSPMSACWEIQDRRKACRKIQEEEQARSSNLQEGKARLPRQVEQLAGTPPYSHEDEEARATLAIGGPA